MHVTPIAAPLLTMLLLAALAALCLARLRSSRHAAARRWAERLLLVPLALIAVGLALSCLANALLHRYHAARLPAPGRLVMVDGSRSHLLCTGSGSPTLVFEAGLASGALSWGAVQPELSKLTRVCSYDRAGLGWSAPRAGPRDAEQAVKELAALLDQAGVDGPLVLVGHSLGGLYARLYASRHPQRVAALVLVDSATPWDADADSPALKAYLARRDADATAGQLLARALFVLGIPRLGGACSSYPPALPEDLCDPDLGAVFAEAGAMPASRAEAAAAALPPDLPLLVISQDTTYAAATEAPPQLAVDWARNWDRRQAALLSLSTRGHRVVARGSGHFVPFDRPEVIEAEVAALVRQLRGAAE